MTKCRLYGGPADDELYCGRCEKLIADAWMDLKAELGVEPVAWKW